MDCLYETFDTRYGRLRIFANDGGAIGKSLRKYGEWAENELRFMRSMIDEGVTVIDVGAYIGTHSLAFSHFVGPKGRVVAIEPQPSSFELLARNIEMNALKNISVENAAASFEFGEALIPVIDIERRESFGSASLLSRLDQSEPRSEHPSNPSELATRVISIDELNLTQCSLVKIDVEGAEDLVLRGARNTIYGARRSSTRNVTPWNEVFGRWACYGISGIGCLPTLCRHTMRPTSLGTSTTYSVRRAK